MSRQYDSNPRMDKSIYTVEHKALQRLLRQVRLGTGLRQGDLAALLGKPQSFVSKYEKGDRRLDLVELHQICQAVGISLSEFVTRYVESLPCKPSQDSSGSRKRSGPTSEVSASMSATRSEAKVK